MTPFPAPPGTYLLERKQGDTAALRIPVVGFLYVQEGPVYPLCVSHYGGLTRGRVLVTADGLVSDPSYGIVCSNVEEWMKLSNSPGYWTAKDQTGPKTAGKAPPAADSRSPVSGADEGREAPVAPTPVKYTTISFGTKTFKTNSFWKIALGDGQVMLFQIAGEVPYPKDERCEKITREDYAALKKAGSIVLDNPVSASLAEAADEEDDGMDLV